MAEPMSALRRSIQGSLQKLATQSLDKSATALLDALGYRSEKTADLGRKAETLLGSIEHFRPEMGAINRAKVFASRWKCCRRPKFDPPLRVVPIQI